MALRIGSCILAASILLMGCGLENASQSESTGGFQEISEDAEVNETDTEETEDELMEQYKKSVKTTAFIRHRGTPIPL